MIMIERKGKICQFFYITSVCAFFYFATKYKITLFIWFGMVYYVRLQKNRNN
jgi:hypothetical protein